MGLFTFLKNGLTIEKKKQEPETEVEPVAEAPVETEEPETVTEPVSPITDNTPADKRLAAEYILYSDTNVTPAAATPTTNATASTEAARPAAPTQQTFNPYSNNVTSSFNNALLGQATANQNLLVISPKSPAEISAILSNLASGNACIVSLANIEDAQRHLDYICGFMNAIGGTIMQRTQTEYILTPKGVGIKS